MKILLVTLGTRGDIEPFVHLAKAALDRGDTVNVMTTIEFAESFDSRVHFTSLPGSMRDLIVQTEANPVAAAKMFTRAIKPFMVEGMDSLFAEANRVEPDVIVFHPKIVAAPLVARAVGAVAVQVEFAPITIPTASFASAGVGRYSLGRLNRLTYALVNRGSAQLFASELRVRSREWGVSPAPVSTVVAVSPAVIERPHDYPANAHITGPWVSDSVGKASREISDFCSQSTIAINFGSMSHPKETVAHLINGIRSSGRRVLLIGGWSALESHFEGDTDVFTTPAVDHAAVFPLCEAVIHHGGAGTTHAVARAGRPQWIIPKLADQPWWRDLSVKEGFGVRSISLKKLTVKSVHTQIEKLASCVPKANELARAMSKENGLASTLELLDSLVAKH